MSSKARRELSEIADRLDWQTLLPFSEAAIAADPSDEDPYLHRALALTRLGYRLLAHQSLALAPANVRETETVAHLRVTLLNDDYRWNEALDLGRSVCQLLPNSLALRIGTLEACVKTFRWEEADRFLPRERSHLGESDRDRLEHYARIIQNERGRRLSDQAREMVEDPARLDQIYSVEWNDTRNLDGFEEAIWHLLSDNWTSPDLIRQAIYLYGRTPKASVYYDIFFKRILHSLVPHELDACIALAKACLREGALDEAAAAGQDAIRADNSSGEAHLVTSRALSALDLVQDEQRVLESCLRSSDPGEVGALIHARYMNSIFDRPKDQSLFARFETEAGGEIRPVPRKALRPRTKVAVCMSGQLRGFRACFDSIKPLIDELSADVFVHTWSDFGSFEDDRAVVEAVSRSPLGSVLADIGSSDPGVEGPASLRRTVEAVRALRATESSAQEFFGARKVVVDDGEDFLDDVKKYWGERNLELPSPNQLKMLYKLWACHEMALEADDYDIVIRIRPDLKFSRHSTAEILDSLRTPSHISCGYFLAPEYHGVSDQFAFGTSAAMSVYSGVWPLLKKVGSGALRPGFPPWLREEVVFYHLFSSGIGMRLARRNIGWGLCRYTDFFDDPTISLALEQDLQDIRAGRRSSLVGRD